MYIGKKNLVDNIDNESIIKQFQTMKTRKKKILNFIYLHFFWSCCNIQVLFFINFFN